MLLLGPISRDTQQVEHMFRAGQAPCRVVERAQALTAADINGAAALLVAEESLAPHDINALHALLAAQPVWSDIPVLVLLRPGKPTEQSRRRERERLPLPQATFLQRPLRQNTLLAMVRFAIRARERQFQIRRNIEQQRLAEQALRKSEKLAVAGRLAASIAHEINNPLESVTNLLYLIQTARTLDDAKHYCELAESELRRVSEIATQTLRFYRQQTQATVMDVAELVDSVLTLYQARLRGNTVRVVRDYATHAQLLCFAGELRQLISNLVSNALDAMRSGGVLTVRLRRARETLSARTGSGSRRDGLRLLIGDTGTGIPDSLRRRIFEPFVTSKGEAGTGLGLWVSAEILRKHEGSLRFYSCTRTRRTGTVFRIFLPFRESGHGPMTAQPAAA